jgi:hypothetical protein
MSLTLNSAPNRIDKATLFSVVTSLVEDSTHVNLRVRADIYHEGIIKATVEKPKGIDSFDFSDILKSLVPGMLFARDSGDIVKTGSIGSQLITSWASRSGTWTTLTTSVNAISSAICTVLSELESNAIAMAPGELYLFYCPDLAASGTSPQVKLEAGGAKMEVVAGNVGVLLMPTTTANLKVILGGTTSENFAGTFNLYKITTNRTTIGSPLAPYFVNFTEVYEDAAGVTTTGATSASCLYRYVPALESIASYLLTNDASLFASKTLRNNICKFFTPVPNEYWLLFFSELVDMELFYSKDGAGYAHTTHPVCYEGWGVIIINVGELMSTVTTSLRIQMKDISGNEISEVLTIYPDASQIDERVVLEYNGLVGGKEYLAFEGIKDIEFATVRDYFTTAKKMRKPISLTGTNRQRIETRFKDIANAEYLKSLMISDDVKKLEASYAAPTPVTIVTDSVIIDKGREFFTNRLEIEYEY